VLTAASGTFLVLAALDWATGAAPWRRAVVALASVVAAAGCALAVPGPATFWGAMHGVPPTRIIHSEDGTGLAVLTSREFSFRARADVYVNGLGQGWIPFDSIHSYLGLVPALLHPSPGRMAIIGLGSGDTVYSAAGRPETQVVECVEIIGGQMETLRRVYERTRYPGVGELLQDPRIRVTVGDGRRFVMQSAAPFDVIEADALRPASAYSGTLYSREYFEMLRSRLAPGGLAVTWAPTARIQHTFDSVFPHVAEVSPMLIGSNEPIAFDPVAIRARAAHATTRTHYDRAGIDLPRHLDQFLSTFRHRQQGTPRRDVPEALLNTDLFPRDELRVP
jgi:spermidine synthase